MTDSISDTLEAHIESLRALDKHRKESGRLRDNGIENLEKWILENRDRDDHPEKEHRVFPSDDTLVDIKAAETIYRYARTQSSEVQVFSEIS
jgi:hypothetical protein